MCRKDWTVYTKCRKRNLSLIVGLWAQAFLWELCICTPKNIFLWKIYLTKYIRGDIFVSKFVFPTTDWKVCLQQSHWINPAKISDLVCNWPKIEIGVNFVSSGFCNLIQSPSANETLIRQTAENVSPVLKIEVSSHHISDFCPVAGMLLSVIDDPLWTFMA